MLRSKQDSHSQVSGEYTTKPGVNIMVEIYQFWENIISITHYQRTQLWQRLKIIKPGYWKALLHVQAFDEHLSLSLRYID